MTLPPRRRSDKIVAIGLLSEEELRNVGTGLNRLYPIADDGAFDDILKALDKKASNAKPRS